MTITIAGYRITLFKGNIFSMSTLPTYKTQVVANIERTNSREYQMQVANHHFVNAVIDDVLSDPYWHEIAVEAMKGK